jgi:SnoaL-like domain
MIDSGMAALQTLLEQRRIEKVLYRYCDANDTADEAMLRSVFHPDATDEHVGIFSGSIAEVLPTMSAMRKRFSATLHVLSNIDIEVEGNVASSRCQVAAHHCYEADGQPYHLVAHGRFIDRLELREGEWRIARRVAHTDFILTQRVEKGLPSPF